ncbi:2790_t:CDS:2 [Paraglomus occultum]|uniref:2790_t:CDS:1 n=1 Tax=Paraglomus occultum TaxID=144539 RepID=A0A9N9AHT1_9GLOM|nr:2790_t:CDS:2 [Paraglomus occultum]
MAQNQPLEILLDANLAGLLDLLQVHVDEPKSPGVRFVESVKISEFIAKSYKGGILPHNKETQRMLLLEEKKSLLPTLATPEAVDQLISRLGYITVNEPQTYETGTLIQLVSRLLAYSLQFRRCLSSVPEDRLTSAISAVSDYKGAVLDLSNPFTTVPWRVLNDFLTNAQTTLKLPFNPYTNATDDIKAIIMGASPFLVSGGSIQPLDTEVSFIENLYRQTAGQYKTFDKASHTDGTFLQFGFKEYVQNRIPMKRVSNGAYVCYVDALHKTYYYTTLTLDPFRFKVLKNLLIYEIVSGKAAYIHSAIHYYLSMCTCEEDFKLMIEYGVIQWGFPMKGYDEFREMMKELLDTMYCWKFVNTWTWHAELVKIARRKALLGDTSSWADFAATCYSGGLLRLDVSGSLYKSLA